MQTDQDPRYRELAAEAAHMLGGGPDLVRAVLAQWQCEIGAGDPWPPPNNNPGNVGVVALRSVGIYRPWGSPPQARCTDPTDGANCYAALIMRASRYAAAVAAAQADDGAAFLRAITDAGYGTEPGCALALYHALADAPAPAPSPHPFGGFPMPASGNLVAGAIVTNCDYIERIAQSISQGLATRLLPYLAHINAQAGELADRTTAAEAALATSQATQAAAEAELAAAEAKLAALEAAAAAPAGGDPAPAEATAPSTPAASDPNTGGTSDGTSASPAPAG